MQHRAFRRPRVLSTGALAAALAAATIVAAPAAASASPVSRSGAPARAAIIVIHGSVQRQAVVPGLRTATKQAAASLPAAFNEKTQQLTGEPTVSDPQSCVSRTIGLVSHLYEFREFIDNEPAVPFLDTGPFQLNVTGEPTFHWLDCLTPQNGTYIMTTNLVAPDGSSVNLQTTNITLAIKGLHTYTWGSELIPVTLV